MKLNAGRTLMGLLFIIVLAGCGRGETNQLVEGKVNVVTSFYPIYEFASAIGGENANVINLLPTGVEPHEWTPRSNDIITASKAQLFFYNGAGLEGWVPNFLKGLSQDSKVKTVEVSKGIALIEAEEGADGHDHGAEADSNSNEPEAHETDPHTWISPKSAMQIAKNIKDSYVQADPAHTADYESRYEKLADQLKQLDAKFTSELSKTNKKEIVVSHQAFGYLCRDYGLTQHAIMGLSPDAEPRAQDIIELTKVVKQENIKYIFFEELVSDKLARTLAGETGVQTLVLNPVEGLTKQEEQNKDNYFTLMEKNLQNLILALQ
ncbi:metal ABC transporter substrate-binding protein [Paenibacillus sp. YPG26]|uniref:metal ABC transporter substrate-binding protein n=1 Tax=Paenibacillus sp. YPG26 TaxID=2878915 RepID=UPI002041EEB8|nr:metal ABC transporter substrate-binding protein [Paenibacillus sp. YPG26]USB34656.1 metal ABC transporter substrate-binding protein [Paenibacillus sp. YPG26]